MALSCFVVLYRGINRRGSGMLLHARRKIIEMSPQLCHISRGLVTGIINGPPPVAVRLFVLRALVYDHAVFAGD